ncbi:MAG: ABC transporter ATP-binding protein [Alphaproteobacteria bacterium]|nr:ABC transporter ATP-binding protein [Alphaproteobacteria bacterium]
MIDIRNLSHTYPGTRKQPPRAALRNLDLSVREGHFCILSGPNGSGKSTLFRILCGMARPSGGSVEIAGHDLSRDPMAVRRLLGVVFQSPAVDKHLGVGENLAIHARLYGLRGTEAALRREEALEWSDLRNRLGDRVDTLSGGLARQLELAKCLMTRPRVLLLDEPTTGLDPSSRRNFLDVLRRVQRERSMTVLMTTHIFSEAEDADFVAILKDGVLLAEGTPQRLREQLGREVVVISPRDPAALADRLSAELGLTPLRHGDELRLDEVEPAETLALLERILTRYRPEIHSISIKQPALEDVFIHITGGNGIKANGANGGNGS